MKGNKFCRNNDPQTSKDAAEIVSRADAWIIIGEMRKHEDATADELAAAAMIGYVGNFEDKKESFRRRVSECKKAGVFFVKGIRDSKLSGHSRECYGLTPGLTDKSIETLLDAEKAKAVEESAKLRTQNRHAKKALKQLDEVIHCMNHGNVEISIVAQAVNLLRKIKRENFVSINDFQHVNEFLQNYSSITS